LEGGRPALPSDTLFGWLCAGWKELFGEEGLVDLLEDFNSSPEKPFLISSAFPFAGETLFFPIPVGLTGYGTVQYLSEKLFRQICAGELPAQPAVQGEYGYTPEEGLANTPLRERISQSVLRERAHLGPSGQGGEKWALDEVHFNRGCGLYFLADVREDILPKFEAVIRLMADRGIGGKTSKGLGKVTFSGMEEVELGADKGDCLISLSLLYSGAILAPQVKVRGKKTTRTGWVHNANLPKLPTDVFIEGSWIIGSVGAGLKLGGLIDVTPDGFNQYRVYRYGYPFGILARFPKGGGE
jgi:CRISPR-associated protein Csm4